MDNYTTDCNEIGKEFKNDIQSFLNKMMKEEQVQLAKLLKSNGEENVIYNGYYNTTIKSAFGPIDVTIPRFRNHTFKPSILIDMISLTKSLAIELYGHGLSTYRISDVFASVLGINVCKSTVANICKDIDGLVTELKNNPIDDCYKVIYIDAKYFSVKSVGKNKSAFLSAIGRNTKGETKLLHTKLIKKESEYELSSFISELHKKLEGDDYLFIVDGNTAITNAIKTCYPNSNIQRCLFHVMKNIKNKLSTHYTSVVREKIMTRLYEILFTEQISEVELKKLAQDYPQSSVIILKILKSPNVFTFTKYESKYYHQIRTNNVVEQYHANLELVTSGHRSFKDEGSLLRAIVKEIQRFNSSTNAKIKYENFRESKRELQIKKIATEMKKQNIITIDINYNGVRKIKRVQITQTIYDYIYKLLE